MKTLKGFNSGINLGGWLSQCDHKKETYENYITESDIEAISRNGLDHIRVPIDYNLIEDEDGNRLEEGFKYIDRAIGWSRKYGLGMILDLHSAYGFSFDDGVTEAPFFYSEEIQERFYKLWEELASRYSQYEDSLILELLNEVTDKKYCETWNSIIEKCIERIRAISPTIRIMFGGYYNNSIESLVDLVRPDDDNIVYTFHCYEPLIFTHQGAYWAPGMDENFRMSINEPYKVMKENSEKYLTQVTVGFDDFDEDDRFDIKFFDKYFSEAVSLAKDRDVPLYCGEYGVIDLAEPEETLKWYKITHEAFEKYGIGRAAWNYRGKDFGFTDEHMKPILKELVTFL